MSSASAARPLCRSTFLRAVTGSLSPHLGTVVIWRGASFRDRRTDLSVPLWAHGDHAALASSRTAGWIIRSAARSAIIIAAALVFALTIVGMIDASTTLRCSIPCTRS